MEQQQQLKKLAPLVQNASMLFEWIAWMPLDEKCKIQLAIFLIFDELSMPFLKGIKKTLKNELKKEMGIAKKFLKGIEESKGENNDR